MPITEILEQNAKKYPEDIALVEINPQELEDRHLTWRDYSLMEPTRNDSFRCEITWDEFDRKANRMANFLLTRNIKKGSKVAILLALRSNSSQVISQRKESLRVGSMRE